MKDSESVEDFFNRVISLVNQLRVNGEDIQDQRIVEKILRSLTPNFEYFVVAIEELKDLASLSIESLLGSLQSHELRMKQFDSSPLEQAFQTQVSFRGGSRGRGRERGRNSFRGRGRNGGERNQEYEKDEGGSSTRGRGRGRPLSQIQCYHCQKFGHTMKYCRKKIAEESKKDSTFMHEKEESKEEDTLFLACNVQEVALEETWYIDSGYNNHMTGNKGVFVKLDESLQSEVRTGDDKRLSVRGSGDILVQTKKGVKHISNIFYVPGLKHNLLSVGQLLMKGHDVHFKEDVCEIKDKNHVLIAKVRMTQNKMFPLKFQSEAFPCFNTIVKDMSWL
ncbi:uncharacterized protein LOC143870019 [Tasmannia lanceolata]|uniref:uncharacterized protein LOC143870019 n=1 Tax=Tasmannia lanceolata TaxID=3420 RepID=UPI00406402E7